MLLWRFQIRLKFAKNSYKFDSRTALSEAASSESVILAGMKL